MIVIYSGEKKFILKFTLRANSADDKCMIFFFLFFPDNRLLHFMQAVSYLVDNLHKM